MRRKRICEIPGYENVKDYYWVEDTGLIWSNASNKYLSLGKRYNNNKLRDEWKAGKLDKEPYYILFAGLHVENSIYPITYPVHRIVAKAFLPNPQNLPEVNHIDKNTSNNDYTNLEWIDKSKNIKLGLSKGVWQCDKNTHERIKKYDSFADVERAGFNRPNIIAVCKGRRKSAQNYFWEYDN